MTNKEFKVMLVLAAAAQGMTGLQVKRAIGGFLFMPWSVLYAFESRGWVRGEPAGNDSRLWTITDFGRRALAQDVQRRSEWA